MSNREEMLTMEELNNITCTSGELSEENLEQVAGGGFTSFQIFKYSWKVVKKVAKYAWKAGEWCADRF